MDSLAIFGLDAKALIFCVLAVLGGAFLKGYTGFGASMFWVTSLSLVLPPVQVVPMVMIFEVVSSLVLLPGIWPDIRWNSILALFAGTLVATPIGILALSNLPADPIRVALAVVVFLSAVLIRLGFRLEREPGRPTAFGVGMLAGVLNGSMGVVGPPAILFYFSSPVGVVAGRASIIAYFIGTDSVGTAMFASQGLIGREILVRTLAFMLVLVIGVRLGSRGFLKTDEATFRRNSLYVLMALSAALGLRALL